MFHYRIVTRNLVPEVYPTLMDEAAVLFFNSHSFMKKPEKSSDISSSFCSPFVCACSLSWATLHTLALLLLFLTL